MKDRRPSRGAEILLSPSMPHRIFGDYKLLCLLSALASVALSLWAIHLDPVINRDGVYYVRAAEHFASGKWSEALAVYKWPFYSFVVGAVIKYTGLASGHATYLVSIALYVLLVIGFTAFVQALGGRGTVLWIAALVILFYPMLNKFRPFVIRDVGYWACYLWSLAYFLSYLRLRTTALLWMWAAFMVLAFLFRVEGLAFLIVLPVWLAARGVRDPWKRAATGLAVLVSAGVLSGFTLWQHVSDSGASPGELLANPLQHIVASWGSATGELADRLNGLQREFGGPVHTWIGAPVYLGMVAVMIVVECVEVLGIVYAGILAYGLVKRKVAFEPPLDYWWKVLVCLQLLLLIAFGFLNFFLADRYPVGLALTLLAPVPFLLNDLWLRWRARPEWVQWKPAAVALLLIVSSVEGLDVKTGKRYLREAGLWLRGHAAAGQSMYSNSVILFYYAGLGDLEPRPRYSWEEAMRLVWTGDWRQYDYLALIVEGSRAQHRGLIVDKIGKEPDIEFASSTGDQVLIFSSQGNGP